MTVQDRFLDELETGRSHAIRGGIVSLIALGLLLVLAGIAALSSTAATTFLSVALLGMLLIVGGIAHIVGSFAGRGFRETLPDLFVGILTGIVGLILISRPAAAAAGLTLLLAAFFLVSGVMRLVAAMVLREFSWPWAVLSGIVTVLLGILLFSEWPSTALWALGLYVGISLLFAGSHLLAVGVQVLRVMKRAEKGRRPAAEPEARPPLH